MVKQNLKDKKKLFNDGQITKEEIQEVRAQALKDYNSLKTESWRKFASEELNAQTSPSKVFSIIRKIDGRSSNSKPGTPLKQGNQTLQGDTAKANAFIKAYSKVSDIPVTKEEKRRAILEAKTARQKNLQEQPDPESLKPYTEAEFERSLSQMKLKKAPGHDQISNEMLLRLGTNAKAALLNIFNRSWLTSVVPTDWKRATIIPIPKPGKDPSKIDAHRPISLTCCCSKLKERLFKDRMVYILEKNNKLSPNQAGFRSLHSTEDQVLRMTQTVADGFHSSPMKRTVMTLIDFSRAFDTVWKWGLYKKLHDLGLPDQYVKWIKAFLSDRVAEVRYGSETSRKRSMVNGLPQGSVLSPILFLCFINDICDGMDIEVSLFADDLAMWSQHHDIHQAEKNLQKALDKLEEWTQKWKLQLNIGKCETTLFTTSTMESKHVPHLLLKNTPIANNKNPTFLGVTFDRSLSFNAHVKKIQSKMKKRNQVIQTLRGRDWGLKQQDMRQVYITYIRSAAEYCTGAWGASLSKTQMEKIEVAERASARVITNCTKSTPKDSLMIEAKITPFSIRSKELTARAYEKSLRLPGDNPRRVIAEATDQKKRLKKEDWKKKAKNTIRQCGLEDKKREEFIQVSCIPPWNSLQNISFNTELTKPLTKKDPVMKQKQIAEETIALTKADINCYTDGSTTDLKNGGSGATIDVEPIDESKRIEIKKAAGEIVSSYKTELVALKATLNEIEELQRRGEVTENQSVTIFTDSESSVKRLQSASTHHEKTLNDIQLSLQRLQKGKIGEITFQWIPGHCGIEGNETADRLAREACDLPQDDTEIDFQSAKYVIRKLCKEKWLTSAKPKFPQAMKYKTGDESTLTREEKTVLARFRTGGHTPELGWYLELITKNKEESQRESGACRRCKQPETLQHYLMQCPYTEEHRHRIFQQDDPMTLIYTDPNRVAQFIRSTDLMEPRPKPKPAKTRRKTPPDPKQPHNSRPH